ncbi:DUF992 domain-containing protein [Aliirhizobium cellulosilyticum]|uniref:DUF992 domain-containing protein n=1 Tax=Aliirhizobium cellulosilyticum TaxID=393664 RepID=A0A7W6V0P8_9HYPH|nr:DUF992 domain-containing protein [Rhizobium cellulosilyticum]MBB4349409.1 hypothetical protein [Rhizobium cellulosilyticum]MBB4412369.1 hypothetical protein [Rhizobium cellulosilyticum]MBB4447001.1 hypothetical protein [Rhizobium cellulosilyticum]
MRHLGTLILATAISTVCLPHLAQANGDVVKSLGILECDMDVPIYEAIQSQEDVACQYNADKGGMRTKLVGTITDGLIDKAEIKDGVMRWRVFSASSPMGSLIGTYKSVEAPDDLRLPPYSRVLAKNTLFDVVLEPDVTPQDGLLNFAVGISALRLRAE